MVSRLFEMLVVLSARQPTTTKQCSRIQSPAAWSVCQIKNIVGLDNFFISCRTLLCCCCSRVLWSFGRILQQGSWRPSLYSWGTLHVPGNTGVHGSLVAHTGPMHHPSLRRTAIPETWRSHKLMGSLRHTQLPGLQNPACRRIWSSRIFHRPVASQISQNQVGVSH